MALIRFHAHNLACSRHLITLCCRTLCLHFWHIIFLLNIHKITASSDAQIRDFWHLNDYQSFYDLHHKRLAEAETFKLGKIRYKSENGKLVQVSRYSSEVDIFSIEKDSKDNAQEMEFYKK